MNTQFRHFQCGGANRNVLAQEFDIPGRGLAYVVSASDLADLYEQGFTNRFTDWAIDGRGVKSVQEQQKSDGPMALFLGTSWKPLEPDIQALFAPERVKGVVGVDYIGVTMTFVCIDQYHRLLMHLRTDQCRDEHWTWDTGSGQLEFGEDMNEAVLREVFEEYGGASGKIVKQLPPLNLLREHEGKPTHWVSVPFIIRVKAEEIQIGEPHKMKEFRFVDGDNIPAPLHGCTQKVFDAYWGEIDSFLA